MSSSILVVHEQAWIRKEARACLENAGHRVDESPGLDLGAAPSPDVVLVDHAVLHPLAESLDRIKRHESTSSSRVIVLAPRESPAEAFEALELGADDCVGVPIESYELSARVAAALRRPPARLEPEALTAGPVQLDRARHVVRIRDRPVDLAPTEFRLMAFFLENPGRVFSRAELLRRAWGNHIRAGQRTVDVHVRRLRQQLSPFGCEDMIQTVRGFGYRFSVDATGTRQDVDAFAADEKCP